MGTASQVLGIEGPNAVVNGNRGRKNVFYLDGSDNTATFRNSSLQMPNPEAIQEVNVSTSNTSAEFGKRLPVLAHLAGRDHCRDVEVVADGGPWIWQETARYFPTSVQVLDYYHACEHLWTAAHARYGEATQQAQQWEAKLEDLMYAERSEALCREIRACP